MGVPRLIGMVHLRPLPGAPAFAGNLDEVLDAAVADAGTLATAGFDGIMVENFGDVPFHADAVPPISVAAMTSAVGAIRSAIDVPVGVNMLRNDAVAALSVAAVTGASFVRVNVLSGTMFTDQGPIIGKAAEVARLRARLAPEVAIMADVFVKHATPPPGLRIEDATHDLARRTGADAIVVSGAATGDAPDLDRVRTVKQAADETPVYVGSGVTTESVGAMLDIADGCIVGTALKPEGDTAAAIDASLAMAFVAAAG
jgi:membrane complex biogenesis BtpA family protein